MRITVLGAAGKMATGVIRDLADAPEVKEIVLADLEATRPILEERAQKWCRNKAQVSVVDLGNQEALRKVIRGSASLANATVYLFNLQVMEACLAEGVHYVDFGGLFHVARKQMALSDQWKAKKLTAVVGMGSAPGIVNVMSRFAVDLLDTVETIRITDGIVNLAKLNTPLAIPYALGTILDEFTMNPYVYENGEWKEVPPFSGEEVVDFPPPVGTQTVFCTLHSEVASMPIVFGPKGLKNINFKLALPKAFESKLRFLVDMGFGSSQPLEVEGHRISPRDFLSKLAEQLPKYTGKPNDHKVLRVDVKGRKSGKREDIRLEMICSPFEPWGMPTGAHSVGVPVGVTSRLLGSGIITERGALAAEACVPTRAFFEKLAERNLNTTVMIKRSVV